MAHTYPARYRDALGDLLTTIHSDGRTLRLSLGGVDFEGFDFAILDPVDGADARALSRFTLDKGSLCACSLEVEMPVGLMSDGVETAAVLEAGVELGAPRDDGLGVDETLDLTLVSPAMRIATQGSGLFESALEEIQRQLPANTYLRICFGCGLSDYSPAGLGLFGSLACFRDDKDAYRAVRTKRDLFEIWVRGEGVQETHVCSEFERRVPGTGYRG